MSVTAHGTVSAADLQALRSSVSEFLAARSNEAQVRAAMESSEGYDTSAWEQMAAQLGLQGLIVPESSGGAGCSFVELGVVLTELGRALYPGPFLSTVVATWALANGDPGLAADLLPGIAAGQVATFAFEQPAAGSIPVPMVSADATGALTGPVSFVLDGHLPAAMVVEASSPDGTALYLVAPDAAGVTRESMATTDRTRRIAKVTFERTPSARIGGADLAGKLRSAAATAIACSQIGGAEAAMTDAVAYAKVRTQFGKPIGSFQSIKHLCADMFTAVESGKAAAARAAKALADDDDELEILASIAKAWCSDAYVHAADTNLHIHGGIGFTWEHSAHLHLKRAKTDELLLGDARHHRARLADVLGI